MDELLHELDAEDRDNAGLHLLPRTAEELTTAAACPLDDCGGIAKLEAFTPAGDGPDAPLECPWCAGLLRRGELVTGLNAELERAALVERYGSNLDQVPADTRHDTTPRAAALR
ncbi:hypothetical protein JNW90_29310 [Micromonospora sp. STR1s_5]|nr:hypothetical protein [Micromonospora sp. STR1s_5]